MSAPSGSSVEGDAVALTLQELDGSSGYAGGVAAVKVVQAGVVIGRAGGEHVVGHTQQGVGGGDDRSVVASVRHDAAVSGREGTVLRPDGRERGFVAGMGCWRSWPDPSTRQRRGSSARRHHQLLGVAMKPWRTIP